MMNTTGLLFVAYVLGSIPTGYLIGKIYRVDIRKLGSGNIGATNVQRTLGTVPGLLVLVMDALKGLLPVLLARLVHLTPGWQLAVGMLAVVGHMYPFILRFKGGRGVATGLGVVIGLSPLAALSGALVFVATVALTRYVSLGSIVGSCAAVAAYALVGDGKAPVVIALGAMFLLVVYQHRSNIRRLLAGTESKLGQKVSRSE